MRKLRLMFRWTFVFVLLGMLHVHANAYRQNRQQVTLSMKAVSLKDVLWAIERQTSFVFMYNEEDLDKIGKVWKSHATLTLLATQDLPTFGYNMIDPLKSWCWGSILFYPFKISRFS